MQIIEGTVVKKEVGPGKQGELKKILVTAKRLVDREQWQHVKTLLDKIITTHKLDENHPEFLLLNG
jgi:hypothetical protein